MLGFIAGLRCGHVRKHLAHALVSAEAHGTVRTGNGRIIFTTAMRDRLQLPAASHVLSVRAETKKLYVNTLRWGRSAVGCVACVGLRTQPQACMRCIHASGGCLCNCVALAALRSTSGSRSLTNQPMPNSRVDARLVQSCAPCRAADMSSDESVQSRCAAGLFAAYREPLSAPLLCQ